MARSLWSGSLSFGLLNIPVSLVSAKEESPISFHMLDKRDYGRVGYKMINKKTRKEIPRNQIVKGYERKKNEFVVVTEKDFERANPKAAHTIDLEDFVCLDDVDPLMMEKPYYLIPGKQGEKGYLLLRRVLEETGKVAIGRFVLRNRQKLVAIIPRGDYLVAETLRFAREVLTPNEIHEVEGKFKRVKITARELQMAEGLVKGMTSDWDPEKYEDTYTQDVLKMIEAKAKHGGAVEVEDAPKPPKPTRSNVVDLMPLLKQSLEAAGRAPAPAKKSKRGGKTSRSRQLPSPRKSTSQVSSAQLH